MKRIINFKGTRAWVRNSDEEIIVPNDLIEIQNKWANWARDYGDKGCCVLGAGFEFDYEGSSYRMPPTGPWQGSCSWEASIDLVAKLLVEAGAININYHYGIID